MYYLLKYDTQHIRVFNKNDSFIKFSHLEDRLLPLSNSLFAQSSSFKISSFQIQQCLLFLKSLEQESYKMKIFYEGFSLKFQITTPQDFYEVSFSGTETAFWKSVFIENTKKFSTADPFNLPHQGKEIMTTFFQKLKIELPLSLYRLEIYYVYQFFFIPFEFLYNNFLIKIYYPSPSPIQKEILINTTSIMHDPNLYLSKEESIHIFKLLEKRAYTIDHQNPDVLFISAHGNINKYSYLENSTLESLIVEKNSRLTVFNCCLLAQCPDGIITHFLNKGSLVIVSPFYTLCQKTIFAPLLRFLNHTGEENIWKAFSLLKIFYPNIYKYFRLYIPYQKK